MRVVVFEAEPWERGAFAALGPAHEVTCADQALTPDTAAAWADAEIVSVFIGSDLGARTLAALPGLRLIATRSTGYDHIDLDACRRAGIAVANVPDYGDPTVAEHAFALLLAVTRRIVEAAGRTRRGDFSSAGLRGVDLHGRTMGVVGAGRIGRRVIAIARGFGMEVIASDPRPDAQAAAELGFRYAALPDLLARADVVSLHLPGGAATRNLISDAEFAAMKPGAILINTARGGVVDEAALLRALGSGRLAGAGLDVVAEEGLVGEEAEIFRRRLSVAPEQLASLVATEALVRLPNVVVTPHIAYDTAEAVERIVRTTVRNIEAFVAGKPCNLLVGTRP